MYVKDQFCAQFFEPANWLTILNRSIAYEMSKALYSNFWQ